MLNKINLSYVLTTYNKLQYLKIVLPDLIDNCAVDEEVVVIDGGSTDGTKEFLEKLYLEGKIHQFISEKDFGEAHGYNKGILMAKGELIKFICDDDAFCYQLINDEKDFMLENISFDVIAGNMSYLDIKNGEKIIERYDDDSFLNYKKNGTPFWFNGQPLMIRKASLALLGLLNPGVKTVDTEFALRTTFNPKINICWLHNISSVRIDNPNSNFNKFAVEIEKQTYKLFNFYSKETDTEYINDANKLYFFKKTLIYKLIKNFYTKLNNYYEAYCQTKNSGEKEIMDCNTKDIKLEITFEDAYEKCTKWLADKAIYEELIILT